MIVCLERLFEPSVQVRIEDPARMTLFQMARRLQFPNPEGLSFYSRSAGGFLDPAKPLAVLPVAEMDVITLIWLVTPGQNG